RRAVLHAMLVRLGRSCWMVIPVVVFVVHAQASGQGACAEGAIRSRRLTFHTAKSAGYTSSSSTPEVTTPPTIGAAMRFMTSAPVPWDHRTGNRPARIVATVIIFGRMR